MTDLSHRNLFWYKESPGLLMKELEIAELAGMEIGNERMEKLSWNLHIQETEEEMD